MSIKSELKNIIKKSIKKDIDGNIIVIDVPKDRTNGDYYTNIAFILAKDYAKSPMEVAEEIKSNIKSDIIDLVEVVSPGFINIFLSKEYLLGNINKIIKSGKNYGKSNYGNDQKVNIEYVSANPTGTLHIGHGRGAIYGDSLSRIMSFAGYDVTREYYVNDAGNQMVNLSISIKERYKERCGLSFEIPEDGYHGKEIIDLANLLYEKYGETKTEEDLDFFKEEGLNILLDKIKKDLDTLRVNFDVFTSEESLYDRGLVDNTLSHLQRSGKCYIEDDALWLKTTDFGDEKDRVLIKSDGTYTYLLPDIAYHIDKISRKYDKLIDVFGSDHHGYVNRLNAGIEFAGYDSSNLDVRLLQMVRLIKNGEEVKLSKRTGKTITLDELISEVGVNASRYFFASKSLDTQMDFDLDLAISNSNDNPVYYIEYANARICKIIRGKNINYNSDFRTIDSDIAYTILNKLIEFEDIVIASASGKIHIVCNYLYELASLFHYYYNEEKIISDDEEYTNDRLCLLMAIKIVINNAAGLIGLILREEM